MKFTYEGKEFEFRGHYRSPRQGEHMLDAGGGVSIVECGYGYGIRAIVHPVEVLHIFGGVEFRETGEVRFAKEGEYFLWDNEKLGYGLYRTSDRRILEPVRIL